MNTHSYFQHLTSLEVEISPKHNFQSLENAHKNIEKKLRKRKSTSLFFGS